MRHFEFDCFSNLCFHLNFVCRSPRIKKKEKQKQDKEIARFVGLIMKSREVRSGYVLFRSLALTRAIGPFHLISAPPPPPPIEEKGNPRGRGGSSAVISDHF